MERLTKKELRALLECIKECYPICDIETFAQRVVSRLSKIVPTEISFNGVNPRKERNACPTYPHAASTPSQKKIFEPRVREHPIVIHHGKTRETTQGLFQRLGLHNKFYPRLDAKNRIAPRLIKEVAVNCKTKNLAVHEKFLLKLLRPHLNQAYRNAQTITHMQQKLTLVDQALYRLNFGLIFLTLDGKIHLATTGAMQHLTNYLGPQSLRKSRLPAPLWTWIKQRKVALKGKDDGLLQRNPLVLEHQGKRLVIRIVFDLDQSLLLLEEHPTTMQLQSLVPFGLSPREAQVLDWVAQGKTNKEIGVILDLSPRTVQKHLEHIYRKIYVETRTAAAAKAYEIALITSKQTSMFFIIVISSLMN
jgi:DNA-binding CsgD family transcriptional regulator